MDSKSGLLSTVVMMVPLIVVPAIALLRPAIPGNGISTAPLGAATEDDFFNEDFGEFAASDSGKQSDDSQFPLSTTGPDDFSDWFGQEKSVSRGESVSGRPAPGAPRAEAGQSGMNSSLISDPFAEEPGVDHESRVELETAEATRERSDLDESVLLTRLQQLGVTRSLWFSTGHSGQTGFAVFIPVQGSTQYRFEAVADGRMAALKSVTQQVTAWRQLQQTGP
ncbi:MAG: hypothetical protein KDA91_03465 [Planctomycetaceae bacterium]|nr:hypothetical protein [Planctomycetaceae bacterium]